MKILPTVVPRRSITQARKEGKGRGGTEMRGLGGLGGLAEMGGGTKRTVPIVPVEGCRRRGERKGPSLPFRWRAAGDGGNEKDRPYRSLMRQNVNICI